MRRRSPDRWRRFAALGLFAAGIVVAGLAAAAAPSGYHTWGTMRSDTLTPTLVLAGRVTPKVSANVRTRWGVTINSLLVHVGSRVKAGDLIATTDRQFLETSRDYLEQLMRAQRGDVGRAVIDRAFLEKRRATTATLVDRGLIAGKQIEELALKGIEQRATLLTAKRTASATEMQLRRVEQDLHDANIRAPIGGVVVDMAVTPDQVVGAMQVSPEAVLARIVQPGTYHLTAYATQSQVGKLRPGLRGEVTLGPGLPPVSGVVVGVGISPAAPPSNGPYQPPSNEPTTTAYPVVFEFKTDTHVVPDGLVASVRLRDRSEPVEHSLPWEAINVGASGASVMVWRGGAWRDHAVKLGRYDDARVEILDGLSDDDKVRFNVW